MDDLVKKILNENKLPKDTRLALFKDIDAVVPLSKAILRNGKPKNIDKS